MDDFLFNSLPRLSPGRNEDHIGGRAVFLCQGSMGTSSDPQVLLANAMTRRELCRRFDHLPSALHRSMRTSRCQAE